LLLLLDSGIRVSVLCGLKLNGVHDDYLTVFGKGSKEREVGIGPTTSKAIWKYIHQFRRPANAREEQVFLSGTGKPIHRNVVNWLMRRLGEKVGLQSVRNSPHTLRHTFAKLFLKSSKDIYLLGHSSVKITEAYLRDFQNSDARENYQDFSPVETSDVHKARSRKNSKHRKASS
jgi:integrase/recombinase XerD